MFCNHCGRQIADGAKFCTFCGNAVTDSASAGQQQSGVYRSAPQNDPLSGPVSYPAEPSYNANQTYPANPAYPGNPAYPAYPTPGAVSNELPMGWFKFIIYFQLFAAALVNFVNGLTIIRGAHYDGAEDLVYGFYPDLKTVDTVFGVIFIIIAVAALFVRFQLSGFKRGAPSKYYALCIVSTLAGLLYLFIASSVTGVSIGDLADASTVSSIVTSIAMLIINVIYFGNRKHLFVN